MAQQTEDGLLGWLDGPRLAVGAFAFFLLAMLIFLIVLWTDVQNTVDRLDSLAAQHHDEDRAAREEQVATCFSRAAQGPALQRVLLAIELQTRNPDARQDLRDYRELNALNTPTVAECRLLAKNLNVPAPKGVR